MCVKRQADEETVAEVVRNSAFTVVVVFLFLRQVWNCETGTSLEGLVPNARIAYITVNYFVILAASVCSQTGVGSAKRYTDCLHPAS